MPFGNYYSSIELSKAIAQDRQRQAASYATRSRLLRSAEGEEGSGMRRSLGLTLIRMGLRLMPDTSIRGPSAAHLD